MSPDVKCQFFSFCTRARIAKQGIGIASLAVSLRNVSYGRGVAEVALPSLLTEASVIVDFELEKAPEFVADFGRDVRCRCYRLCHRAGIFCRTDY